MILINMKMRIRPEKMSEWLALADSYAKDVNSEDGCLFFQFARSLTDDNEFVCIEGFKDAVAGATHVKQPYVKKFFGTAPDLWPRSRRLSTSTPRMTASARWARSSLADRLSTSAAPQLS
jgi:quinol monooxygenase YgiN